ncbi:hypothetical protein DSL72_007706 [Monilinia vaccinii-corymbosi]|uniref:Mitochondrial import inner membrane translocase subunit TIM50 n=1 Tax=Monilinia vaccinii-corymbosi TaxID=61207 RepID=A0A8A3PHP3_9HELO|nr:hypothetical protein DSL72_007706 [Monilinia vaccinii-corymbosi]
MSLSHPFKFTITARRLCSITARNFSTDNVLRYSGGRNPYQRNLRRPGLSSESHDPSGISIVGGKWSPQLNHCGFEDIETERSQPPHPQLKTPSFARGSGSDRDPSKAFYEELVRHQGQTLAENTMAPMSRDTKTQPSRASGGVPEPTNEYFARTNPGQPPVPSPLARHLLVVIDLNGTLLFRPNRKSPTKFTARPHAQKFLQYCIDTFSVVIWSSAKAQNVVPMCQSILSPDLRNKLVAIWGRETFGLSTPDYNTRVQCYKRLTKLWDDPIIAASHPDAHNGGKWDQTNTVLIDDSSEKARSEPFNLIRIPEFFGDHKEVGDILPQVHDFLNFLSMHENVSATIRHTPFIPQPKADPREATGLILPIHPPRVTAPVKAPAEVLQPAHPSDNVPSKYHPMLGNSEKW